MGRDAADAWTKAYEADKVSIFGGIVALNRPVTREAAELMKPIFLEIIMAPSFTPEALEVLSTKKNLRLLEVPMEKSDAKQRQLVSVTGGLLVQDLDLETRPVTADMCVTEKRPTERQLADLDFGWRIVKHVKSNAIVVVKDGRTLGVGAGQMNRIGSAELALKAGPCPGCDRRAGTGFGRLFPLRRLREPGGCERRRGDRAAGRQRPGRGFDPEGQ